MRERVHPDQQQFGIEDEHERQDARSDAVPECGESRLQVIAARDRGGRERGQPHRRRHVGHQSEVEDEHVDRHQRHHQPALRAELDHDRRHQGRDDDVARGGRHAHAEDDAYHGDQEQHADHVAGGDRLDQIGHDQPEAGDRDRAHDDAGGGGGNRDADHVPRTRPEAVDQIVPAGSEPRQGRELAAKHRDQRLLREQDRDQQGGRVKRRQSGGEVLDHQHPDQQHHRQQIVQAREQRFLERRQLDHRRVRIVDDEIGLGGDDAEQCHVDHRDEAEDDPDRRIADDVLDPAEPVINDVGEDHQRGERHHDARESPEW